MKRTTIFTAVAVFAAFATASVAQNMQGHDNGTGGAGATGAGMLGGTSSMEENPYHAAVRLIHHEKYADAIPYLDVALQERPANANVLSYAGYAHSMVGDYNVAVDYFHRALASDPDHKEAHQHLGELYVAVHDITSAKAQLAELTRICPSGCDEKDALAKAIAGQQASASSAPPAAH